MKKLLPKLVATIFIVASILVGLTTVMVLRLAGGAIQNVINDNQVELNAQTMDKLDRFFYERSNNIQNIAQQNQLSAYIKRPLATDEQSVRRSLQATKTIDATWNDLSLIDTRAKTLLTSTGTKQDKLTLHPTLRGAYSRALEGEAVSTDIFLTSNSSIPSMVFMAPVRSQDGRGEVLGVVMGELAWESALDILHSLTNNTAYLINRDGYVLGTSAAHDSSQPLKDNFRSRPAVNFALSKDKSGSKQLPSLHTKDEQTLTTFYREAGFMSYGGNSWTLILQTPVKQAFAPAQRIVKSLILMFMAVLTLTGILAIFFINAQIIRPIRRLREAAAAIAAGNLRQKLPVKSNDELGQLAHEFNHMSKQLSFAGSELERERARLLASIDSLPLGLMLTDSEGKILNMNHELQKILRLTIQQLEAAMHNQDLPHEVPILSRLLNRSRTAIATKRPLLQEQSAYGERVLRTLVAPIMIQDGHSHDVVGAVILIEDITEAKVLERSRDEFFSIASHELRTPLTAIRGNASMILDFYADAMKKEGLGDMVGDIHASSVRLIEIVNDFLDASRLEQGKILFKMQAFSIEEIVERVVYEMGGISREKSIHVKMENDLGTLPLVWADKDRVKQVVYNLVGNALKFVEKGGVTVSAKPIDDMLKVYVTDTGRGISVQNQKLLFHKFQQANSSLLTRDTTRGTGLGLYISKLLLQKMKGSILLEHSEEGKGSTFSFTLPLATNEQLNAGKKRESSTDKR